MGSTAPGFTTWEKPLWKKLKPRRKRALQIQRVFFHSPALCTAANQRCPCLNSHYPSASQKGLKQCHGLWPSMGHTNAKIQTSAWPPLCAVWAIKNALFGSPFIEPWLKSAGCGPKQILATSRNKQTAQEQMIHTKTAVGQISCAFRSFIPCVLMPANYTTSRGANLAKKTR